VNDCAVSVSHRFAEAVYEDRQHLPIKTGNHRREGVILGYGRKFRRGYQLESPVSILDIAPTVLHLLDQSVPASMDGRVAVELLKPEFQAVNYINHEDGSGEPVSLPAFSADESEILLQHLRDLGYLG